MAVEDNEIIIMNGQTDLLRTKRILLIAAFISLVCGVVALFCACMDTSFVA